MPKGKLGSFKKNCVFYLFKRDLYLIRFIFQNKTDMFLDSLYVITLFGESGPFAVQQVPNRENASDYSENILKYEYYYYHHHLMFYEFFFKSLFQRFYITQFCFFVLYTCSHYLEDLDHLQYSN